MSYKLCYIEKCTWAYFTTQEVTDQRGDDWNDKPLQSNAGPPYIWEEYEQFKPDPKPSWSIRKVAFDGSFTWAGEYSYCYSVDEVNAGCVAWLSGWDDEIEKTVAIQAGVDIETFDRLVRECDGRVYYSKE